jgi:hypothetical protein
VGNRADSTTYIRMKTKAASETGIRHTLINLSAEATADEIVHVVNKLNHDQDVSGLLVQLPLGDHIDADGERKVTEAIIPEKDVDGCVPFFSPERLLSSSPAKSYIHTVFSPFYIGSTRITLATCHPAFQTPCLLPVHHWELCACSNLPASHSPALTP